MSNEVDARLNDHELTVLVDAAAEGATNSRSAMGRGLDWSAMGPIQKAAVREAALPFIFHGTKALHDLGYRKPRTITTEEEVEAFPQGTRLYSLSTHEFWILNDLTSHGGVKVHGTGGGYTYVRDFIRKQAPLEVMHVPGEIE